MSQKGSWSDWIALFLGAAGTFSRTLAAAGTYHYQWAIHGTPNSGMRGTLVVQ